jgi:uncharacterized phage-associated protein
MITAINVSELFLSWGNKEGEVITNLKMQKLLYYAEAWHLVNFKCSLFKEEIEAWQYGPVIREAYNHFKEFNHTGIEYLSTGLEEQQFNPDQLEFLTEFYDKFIVISAHSLVNSSHSEKPWMDTFDKSNPLANNLMSKEKMKTYYNSLVS